MTQESERDHRWRFFRSGGFDQVRIETVSDLKSLTQLDKKLWASLACPVDGLEFDARTLAYIDTDNDKRIRVPEILAAVQWALDHLDDKGVLFRGKDLPLKAIHTANESGQQLLSSARRILINLGKADAEAVSVDDTGDMAKIFPPDQANGDGIVPATFTADDFLKAAIADIITALGSDLDRSGELGVSADRISQFFTEADALLAWEARSQADAVLQPLGENSGAAVAAWQAVAAKVDDFFMRTQLAAYDARAQSLMNGSEADLTTLAAETLSTSSEQALRLPLAQVTAEGSLPLRHGLNPAWAAAIANLRDLVVVPLLGERDVLSQGDWQEISGKLAAYVAWLAEKPAVATAAIATERLAVLVKADAKTALLDLAARDLAVAAEADSILDVDRLVRYQRNLVSLLNNVVAMKDFYTRSDKAVFQAGTLYLDSRSFDLCVRVADAGKHAVLASLSRTYLAYCDCTRQATSEKITIVVAVTAGSAGNLMVGRNGVFYDRAGRDWDATITKLVENPISIREAFWSPYRRIAKMISEQMMKMAASRDQAITNKAVAGIGEEAGKATAAPPAVAPATPPAPPFDIGKMVGIFAAIGLALGAIGTALAAVLGSFMSLRVWQMPLAVLGIMLIISGPAMIIAWFKLRGRNLGPILDANGWAVNTEAKINIPFGTALTQLAKLPPGSERALTDPYASKKRTGWWVLLVVAVLAGCYFGWKKGAFTVEKPVETKAAPTAASGK